MSKSLTPLEGATPAEPAEIAASLAFALQFRGCKRIDTAADAMAWITADHLVEHLRVCGFVVLKQPPAALHAADYPMPGPRT